MKRAAFLAVVVTLVSPLFAAGQVAEGLREQIKVREGILTRQIRDLAEMREELSEIWTRLEQQTGGLLQAQRDGETVESLPEGYRSVFLLRGIQGLSTRETSEILNVTPAAIKSRLHRSRHLIKERLNPYLEQ